MGRGVREREEMTGWDSQIQRGMGPCTQAQSTSVTPLESPAVSAEWEGEGEKEVKQGKSKN
jgi:hypothetical protein